MADTAVLLLAYGSPETPDQVEPYFTHIRGGRVPSPEAVAHLKHRYQLIGGRTPLLDVTTETARALQATLDRQAPGVFRAFVGMKHWHPYISDAVKAIGAEGYRRLIAIILAPHFSDLGRGNYRDYLDAAVRALPSPIEVTLVEGWSDRPEFIGMMADLARAGIASFPAATPDSITVVFSAHSLPTRLRDRNERYLDDLRASCEAVAAEAAIRTWRFAWQSAGATGEPWLGPDLIETLGALRAEGVRRVLSVPIGFVSDHLEVLYDIDCEAAARARDLGIELHRTAMPNASPPLIATLAGVVAAAARGPSVATGAAVR